MKFAWLIFAIVGFSNNASADEQSFYDHWIIGPQNLIGSLFSEACTKHAKSVCSNKLLVYVRDENCEKKSGSIQASVTVVCKSAETTGSSGGTSNPNSNAGSSSGNGGSGYSGGGAALPGNNKK